ncbi:MAG TPA: hypothetical protein VKB88_44960 [Bryobacteraceae bacterium]|nr:hypothetical protein [Bryobacteraceae bacterium]
MGFGPLIMLVVGVFAGIGLMRLAALWSKYRGERVVTCPENQRPAGVTLDAGHAAASGLGFRTDLRLSTCSRWPEKAGCGQECLSQIAAAPQDCLVRNILAKWYEGKSCRSCGRPIGPILAGAAHPAVRTADKISVEWSEIPAEQLQDVLSASQPVCFACHMASRTMREHPELVTDRSARTGRPGR